MYIFHRTKKTGKNFHDYHSLHKMVLAAKDLLELVLDFGHDGAFAGGGRRRSRRRLGLGFARRWLKFAAYAFVQTLAVACDLNSKKLNLK